MALMFGLRVPFTGSREEPDLPAALLARVRRGSHQCELNCCCGGLRTRSQGLL